MDGDDISPSPKRRRTSSEASSRRSSPGPERINHNLPLRSPRSHNRREDTSRPFQNDSSGDEETAQLRRYARRSRSRLRSHSRSRNSSKSSPRSQRSRSRSTSTLARSPPRQKKLSFTHAFTLSNKQARGISSIKFSPDASYLATASADGTIDLYEATTVPFTYLRTLTGAHYAGINIIAWSPDSLTLASGSDDKSIRLWDVATGTPHARPLLGHSNYVYSLSFSPKGNMLVSGSYDEAVFLWDVRAGRIMRSLPAHSDPVSGVDFLRDGTMVCSCAGDGLIRIWDAGTGQCLKTLVHEDRRAVTGVRFTPNGRFVCAWTLDSSIRLWDYVEGACVKTYHGHRNREYSLSGVIGSYGEVRRGKRKDAFVASGSEDGGLFVWDVSSKDILWKFEQAHRKVILSIDFARRGSDGRGMIASGGLDREVKIWLEDDDENSEE